MGGGESVFYTRSFLMNLNENCWDFPLSLIGVLFRPQLVEEFINETYYHKYQSHPSQGTITMIFSIIVSIYCIGGMIGGLMTAFAAEKFGRKGGLLFNNVFAVIAACLMGFSKVRSLL